MLESFRLGGFAMFPTALFGALLLGAALRYARTPDARFIPLQVALAILTLATGALGFVTGLIASTTHLGEEQAERPRGRARAFLDAQHLTKIASPHPLDRDLRRCNCRCRHRDARRHAPGLIVQLISASGLRR